MKNKERRNHLNLILQRSFCIFFLLVIQFTYSVSYGQTQTLTIHESNKTVKEILNIIEKNSEMIFFYTDNDVDLMRKVTLDVNNQTVPKILEELFKNSNTFFRIDGRQVFIAKKPNVVNQKTKPEKKTTKVTGTVKDETNQSVIGANVVIEGSTTGTITDINGFFSIDVQDNARLKISYVGYETIIVDVNGKNELNISMSPTSRTLDELVVVGYGLQKKSDVTGSIGQVKSEQIKNIASSNIGSALQGKVSGVYIMNSSGLAESEVDIRIRGVTSLNNVAPLWVIDGVPSDPKTVNMNDVENIDIIKDGTAAAIYGVKAAAGVILVTTKRGVDQKKPKISFNTYTGLSSAWRLPEMLNSDQYITLKNEQWATSGVPVGLSLDSIGKYPTTNWIKEMFRQGRVQNYDLNISGTSKSSNYYIGGNYFRNDPSFIDNSLERFSFRINSDYNIADWIKIGESLSLLYTRTNPVADGDRYIDGLFRTPPMMPVYDEHNQPGGFGYVEDAHGIGDYDGGNPMANQLTNKALNHNQKVSGNIYATIKILPGLTVTSTFAGDVTFEYKKNVSLPYYLSENKRFSTTNIYSSFAQDWSMLFNVYANYIKDFGLSNINLTAGYEASKYAGSNLNASGIKAKYGLFVLDQTDPTGRTSSGNEKLGRSLSQFGRATYQYDNKYVAQVVLRRDGSDKFGDKNRYGIFPSVSFAWKLSEESFIKNIPVISFLKLRGGYGVNGNDYIDQYQYVSTMVTAQGYPYGTFSNVAEYQTIIASWNMANPYIQWERSKQLDVGLELGLFKNALFINVEPYQKVSDKMLFEKELPLSSGLAEVNHYKPSQVINTGRITNTGLDVSLTYKGNISDFKYSLGANISTVNYKVNELADNSPLLRSEVLADGVQVSKTTVGEGSGYFFGYQCDGIFQTQAQVDEYHNKARAIAKEKNPGLSESALANIYYNGSANTAPGDLIFRDLNGDGVITPLDREKIGTPWPKATYGLQLAADYKGIDLLITSSGVYGRDVFNVSRVQMYQFSSYDYSTTTLALTRWTPDKPSITNYRIEGNDPNKNMSNPSSWYIEDGSFFRIKNLEIGYSIPSVLINKIGISRLRIYMSGQNLLTVTKYSGFDPEFGMKNAISSGVDYGSHPQSKVYMMGLQVEF